MQTTLVNVTAATSAQAVKSNWFLHGGGPVSLQLISKDTLAGAWKVFVSNKPNVANVDDAEPADITSGFQTPAGGAIAAAAGATLIQFVQTTYLKAGAIQVVMTPSSGTGDVRVHLGA